MQKENLIGRIPDNIYQQVIAIPQIDGPLRMSNFCGQCAHESGNFTIFTENLNYSADSLLRVFPKYFSTQEVANAFARKPEFIANKVYASRMGNGGINSGDGWKYRGRGALQTTGKSNYKALGDSLGVDLLTNPDLVATDYAIASAAFFFTKNNLWVLCDKGIDVASITILTHRINGGENGLSDRIQKTQAFYKLLTSTKVIVQWD